MNIKFSLIIATVDRECFLDKCLESISKQTYKNFEVLVIDQSLDDKSKEICEKYNEMDIKYIKSKKRGLSLNRNIGIKESIGDYICLIDDDATYKYNFLENAFAILSKTSYDILSGVIYDKNEKKYFLKDMDKVSECNVNFRNMLSICASASMIIKLEKCIELNGFDEDLGVGAKFGSGEETDYIIRALNEKQKVHFSNKLVVYHRYPSNSYNLNTIKRAFNYGLGQGALCKKYFKSNTYFCIKLFLILILKATIKYFLSIGDKKSYYKNSLIGRIKGFKMYNYNY